jgi:hypothetical protein
MKSHNFMLNPGTQTWYKIIPSTRDFKNDLELPGTSNTRYHGIKNIK